MDLTSSLPTEIFLKIFDYLPFGELLQCSETCRRWKIIVDHPKFIKKIYLTIDAREFKTKSKRIETMMKTKRQYLNLCLKSINLRNFEEFGEFFDLYGKSLKYLRLEECQTTHAVFVEIIKRLPYLETLAFNSMIIIEDLYTQTASMDIKTLHCLYGYFNHVKTLIIQYSIVLSDVVFDELMYIMPNIEHLTLTRKAGTPSEPDDISWDCLKMFIIRQANRLKTLEIRGWIWNEEVYDDLSQIRELNLEVLEIAVVYYHARDEKKLSNFLKTQKQLKILKMTNQYLLDSHLETIAEHLKYLEVLEFHDSNQITDQGISHLHKLRVLKTLVMQCLTEPIITGFQRDLIKYKNEKLKQLEINLYCHEQNTELYRFCGDICKLFSNLTILKLEMNDVDDKVVQNILGNLRWLESLSLIKCCSLTDYGLTGIPPIPEVSGKTTMGFSIAKLTGLKKLSLIHSELLTVKSIVEIVKCKELQHILLECSLFANDTKYINSLLRNLGSLHYLCIRNLEAMKAADMESLTNHMPRLKHFLLI